MSRHQKRAEEAVKMRQAKAISKLYLKIVALAEELSPGRHPEVRIYQKNASERWAAVLLDPPADQVPADLPEGTETKSNILEVLIDRGNVLAASAFLHDKMARRVEAAKKAVA
jgi:hypothetical protein